MRLYISLWSSYKSLKLVEGETSLHLWQGPSLVAQSSSVTLSDFMVTKGIIA